MSAKIMNNKSKYINDSISQLEKGKMVYAISDKMKRDLEHAIDDERLDVTRLTYDTYWSYELNKEEKK